MPRGMMSRREMSGAGERLLIVNADDYGLTEGVCAGIAEAIREGVVTSTTAMVASPGATDHLKRWVPELPGRIGLHLQLTGGRPLLPAAEVPSLVTESGEFRPQARDLRSITTEEVGREWRAQLACLRALGVEPTHLDSHHHVHFLRPAAPAYAALAAEERLPARTGPLPVARALQNAGVACPRHLTTSWHGAEPTVGRFLQIVENAFTQIGGGGTVELMCHPGYVDAALVQQSNYVEQREQELGVLRDPELRELLRERKITLIGYAALACR